MVAQWLPIYESDEETVKTELATFFSVFPNATVWSNYFQGDGYDLVLIGREDSSPINIDGLQKRLDQSGYARELLHHSPMPDFIRRWIYWGRMQAELRICSPWLQGLR